MKLLFENWREYMKEGDYKSIANKYTSYLAPTETFRTGRGFTSSKTSKKDNYPDWPEVGRAIKSIHSELMILKDQSKVAEVAESLVTVFIQKNQDLWIKELTESAEWWLGHDEWQRISKFAAILKKYIPEQGNRFGYIRELIEFIEKVSGTRTTMQSLGFNLSDISPEDIPQIPQDTNNSENGRDHN